eukprot:CAMPEP_0174300486 /NCGR_PEP_ID=MMETSP0809-20121228/58475_1 /TAXON_ID=73025 ORGANISM="Eutreptiella gymnastica-like, Strain CCMP1594" /NCGR_SAMPLE_ID=MMETSP0809 /ASSEMBLY_ACC=CAM_ASM_000658 /LENGTH=38 /DNA_ID= /DNA_START= /DNA_END= /DNA_ORIENTATION=
MTNNPDLPMEDKNHLSITTNPKTFESKSNVRFGAAPQL